MIVFKNAVIHSPPQPEIKGDLVVDGGIIADIRPDSSAQGQVYADKILLPGYIDSHIHLLEYGYSLMFLDLRDTLSSEQVLDSLSSRLQKAKDRGFMYAFNLAPERLEPANWQPATEDLNSISGELPIIIRREDGHSIYLNTPARRWLLPEQPIENASDPLTGRLNEHAVERIQERIPIDMRREAFIKAGQDLLSRGVTAASVMIGNPSYLDDIDILRGIENKVGIKPALFPQSRDVEKVTDLGLTRLGGCILIDGSFGSRTAALRQPYSDEPGNNGIHYFSQKELNRLVKAVDEQGLQMTFHAIGDEAIELLLNSYEKVIDKTNPLRHRIEHAELMPPDLLDRAAGLNLILSVQPMFQILWGQENGLYQQRLGERRRWTNPFRSALDRGLRLIGGSDAPITDPDPAKGIHAFTNHTVGEESITASEALKAYTYDGAWSVKLEDQVGSLKIGFDADILVFDADPCETNDFRPQAVLRRGKLVYGKLT